MSSRSLRNPIVWLAIGLLLWFSLSFRSHSTTPTPNDHDPPKAAMRLRPATSADLDKITALGLASLPDDPVWPYRFPGASAYPDDHYKYSRIRFSEYLDSVDAGVYQSMVVELSARESEGRGVPKIIAFSMWSLPESWRPPKKSGAGVKVPLSLNPLSLPEMRLEPVVEIHTLGTARSQAPVGPPRTARCQPSTDARVQEAARPS